jgi:hypothetical protein
MWKRLAKWWDLQEDVRTLRGLDDRMLEDMGLTRAEIRGRVMAEAGEDAPRRVPEDSCGPWGVAAAR